MKPMRIVMPEVRVCMATDCSYNLDQTCHAKAITVGDGSTAHCDTFFNGAAHVQSKNRVAGVGACKVGSCQFNEDLECMADNISITLKGSEVLCKSYTP